MNTSAIEWTEKTWNPVTGCTPVSVGCEHCYARHMAQRLRGRFGYPADDPFQVTLHPRRLDEPFRLRKPRHIFVCSMGDLFHPGVPDEFILRVVQIIADCPEHTFQVLTKRPERMAEWFAKYWNPDRQVKQPRVENRTCASLFLRQPCCTECGKLFFSCLNGRKRWKDKAITPNYRPTGQIDWWGREEGICDAFVWSRCGNQHGVAVEMDSNHLAVRADALSGPFPAPLKNLWLGVTAENQETADERIPLLLATPAAVRFVSLEPLLGAVDLAEGGHGWLFVDELASGMRTHLHWVIVGGETGPGARPMHPEWVHSVRDQCKASGVPFFFKHWGEWGPVEPDHRPLTVEIAGETIVGLARVGRKAAGRLLDGRTHNATPETGKEK